MEKIKHLFKKKRCTVTIGFNGVLFTFHHGREIEKSVFVKDIKEAKISYKNIFKYKEKYPIYILLDDNHQLYKQKTYPAIRSFDVNKLIKKDLIRESKKSKNEIIRNFIKNKRRDDKRWDILLFWIELQPEIVEWIDFLVLLPKNRLIGIYLLPIETTDSLDEILKATGRNPNLNKKSHINIVTVNSIASGLRQFIFYKNALILNREPDHNLEDNDFAKYFEQDMLRIIQYLKRTFPEIAVSNINFTNILPTKFIQQVDAIKTKTLKITNSESGVIAQKNGIISKKTDKNEILSDEIISNNFINSKKKIFKFSTNRIKKLNILYRITSGLFFVNISMIIFLGFILSKIFLASLERDEEIIGLKLKKSNLTIKLNDIRKQSLGDEEGQDKFYEIIDFGEIDNFFFQKENRYMTALENVAIISKENNVIKKISYSLNGFSPNNISKKYSINVTGSVINKNGDIDKLFTNFDNLILSLKTKLGANNLKYNDIPNNINFNRKFYKYPFDITIESR
jgi:hypothetical protein